MGWPAAWRPESYSRSTHMLPCAPSLWATALVTGELSDAPHHSAHQFNHWWCLPMVPEEEDVKRRPPAPTPWPRSMPASSETYLSTHPSTQLGTVRGGCVNRQAASLSPLSRNNELVSQPRQLPVKEATPMSPSNRWAPL